MVILWLLRVWLLTSTIYLKISEESINFLNLTFIGLTKGSIPHGSRRVKSQIYDNIVIHPVAKQKKRISAPGGYAAFDPLMEREEGEGAGGGGGGGEMSGVVTGGKGRSSQDVNLNLDKGRGGDGPMFIGDDEALDENEEWAKVL